MAYTFTQIQSAVRANVNDITASVTQDIDDAVNMLSNFFSLKKINTSIPTVASQNYIDKPSNTIEIERIEIDTKPYNETNLAKISVNENDESKRFYDYNGAIQILPTPTSAVATKIWYRSGFTPLAGSESTDVPDRLVPLLIILATWFYFLRIVSKVGTERQSYPDMTPKEAGDIATEWKKQFDSMLTSIKTQKNV